MHVDTCMHTHSFYMYICIYFISILKFLFKKLIYSYHISIFFINKKFTCLITAFSFPLDISQEGDEVYDGGQLAPGPVLPVVIQQPREDGEVGQGEQHAHGPQPGLAGATLRGGGAQQAGVNTEHLRPGNAD